MATKSKFRHEDVATVPKGWKVRTVTHATGHRVRVAFPPGRRTKGSGQLVSILHPLDGKNPCPNPSACSGRKTLSNPTVICPRCKRPTSGWPIKRQDRCSPKDWGRCIRQPEDIMAKAKNPKLQKNAWYKVRLGNDYTFFAKGDSLKDAWAEAREQAKLDNTSVKQVIHSANPSSVWDSASEQDRAKLLEGSKVSGVKAHAKALWKDLKAAVKKAITGKRNAKSRARSRKSEGGKKKHKNIDEISQAAKLHEKFVGAPATKVVEIHEPTKVRDDYADLGWCEQLVFHPASDEKHLDLTEISKRYEAMIQAGADPIKAWREISSKAGAEFLVFDVTGDEIRLAASADGKQLYLQGGRQDKFPESFDAFGSEFDHDRVDLGELVSLTYSARKAQAGDKKPHPYYHIFGEDGGTAPRAFFDTINNRIGLAGGTYHLKEAELGIIN